MSSDLPSPSNIAESTMDGGPRRLYWQPADAADDAAVFI